MKLRLLELLIALVLRTNKAVAGIYVILFAAGIKLMEIEAGVKYQNDRRKQE